MATPARALALANMQTALRAISVANGYKSTVAGASVETVLRQEDDLGAIQMPWIGFMPELDRPTYQPFGLMRTRMKVRLWAFVAATTDALCNTAINNLIDDIIAALSADVTRGGNAITTMLDEGEGIQTNEGHPDKTVASGRHIGAIVMVWNVDYNRNTSSS